MRLYKEPEKAIPIKDEVDVLVVGSGPAGFAAAIHAARNNAKTMLIEQMGDVGGIATSGLMSHWAGDTQGGFYDELLERTNDDIHWKAGINPEKLKTLMLNMLEEESVILQLYTFASDVIMDGDSIVGVITESKSGREAIMAKVVIDASGDGDVAAKAGVPYYVGRESDGKMQPMTLMFKVGGVDTERAVCPSAFEDRTPVPGGILQELAKENIPFPAGHVLLYHSTLPGIVTCNITNCIDVDGTKAEDLTKAHYVCRNQMGHIVSFLRKYAPGYENCFVISSAALMGVRETRHFEGEYVLQQEDIASARIFDDWAVARSHFSFDIHNVSGEGLDENGVQHEWTQKKGYTIPYRCFVPKKVENLLLAGRCISGTHVAHASFRVMPVCANIGQAVGTAAALCVKNSCIPRVLNVTELQEFLKKQGVEI